MNDSIGFVMNLYERVLPYLLRETASAVWELGPVKLFLAVMVFLGVIKGLEIGLWLLRRLWLPLTALLAVSLVAFATHS
ncbi:MAG: hypothetical protein V3T92_04110 [Anaerolineae bacterium]